MLNKPNEVLFRLHSINTPEELGVETATRDDNFLKRQHEELGILPGEKVFETKLPQDMPWRLDDVLGVLKASGYVLLNMNVELRPEVKKDSTKPVLSLNFGVGTTTCTPAQIFWVEQYLDRAAFRFAQGYLNPRTDGTSQLAIDCIYTVSRAAAPNHLPLNSLIGLTDPELTPTTPA